MLRFFRNIRKKLATENKVMAYLRYAIGEILLVVIGILIALQINNWNENRKERIIEIKYLKNLKHDLQSDSTDLVYYKDIRIGQSNAAKELIKYAKSKNLSDIYFLDSLFTTVMLWWEFVPNNNTFEELRSSGNLKLIQNDSIKNLLLDLSKENEELVSSRNHIRRDYEEYLYNQKFMLISFLDVNDPDKVDKILDWYLPNRQIVLNNSDILEKKYRELFNNTAFINGLALAAGNIDWLIDDHYDDMLEIIKKLDILIEQNLRN